MSLDLSKYEGRTPGEWVWGDGWDHPDLESFNNDPNANWPEKYMDMGLHGAKEKVVIPIRVDHREMIWDGDLLNPSDRALIADAPQLLAELREAREDVQVERETLKTVVEERNGLREENEKLRTSLEECLRYVPTSTSHGHKTYIQAQQALTRKDA